VTYRVEFQPPALRQLNGFPGGALDALVSAMADVTQYPDDPLRTVPVPSRPGLRQAVFRGAGLVTYEIDEARQVVAVTDVTWVG
jgi:mRNA-degrading endonuclease RelE of RelBE toxin-antitoxin system